MKTKDNESFSVIIEVAKLGAITNIVHLIDTAKQVIKVLNERKVYN